MWQQCCSSLQMPTLSRSLLCLATISQHTYMSSDISSKVKLSFDPAFLVWVMEILFTCFPLRSTWLVPKDPAVQLEVAFSPLVIVGERGKTVGMEVSLGLLFFSPWIIFHIKTQCLYAYFRILKVFFIFSTWRVLRILGKGYFNQDTVSSHALFNISFFNDLLVRQATFLTSFSYSTLFRA